MNAKKLKEIRLKSAFKILDELFVNHLWDPVVTNRMSDLQCENRLNKALTEYFKSNSNLGFYNKHSIINLLEDIPEIIPMMKEYNYHKYKEENNL